MKATINTEIRFLYGKLEQELFGQFLRMQLDLQSHGAFAPENIGNWSSSPQIDGELSPRSRSRDVSRFSRGPLAGITASTFSIQLGQTRLHIS